jgi:glycosyltransferase involved in cell wall biosynthesis
VADAGVPLQAQSGRGPGNLAKVCVIASTYPRSEDDVAVPWLREEVRLLAKSGYDVSVFAPSYRGLGDHALDGVPVRRFRYFLAGKEDLTHDSGAPSKVHKIGYFAIAGLYVLRGTLAFASLHRAKRFDIVHVHWPFPHANFVSLLKGKRRPKVVLNFHGAELALARKFGFVRKNLARHVKKADAIVANSTHTANEVKRLVGDVEIEIKAYGSPVATSDLRKVTPLKPTILYVGRLIERKGVDYLIAAFQSLRKEMDAELTIVGTGVLLDKLIAQAKDAGLSSSIKFLTDIGNEELAKIYLSSSVFMLPAIVDSKGDTEGLGVVLIEAMTFGLPVVASNVGGIPDVVLDEKTGVLVPEKDPQAIKDALLRVLRDESLQERLTAEAKRHIEESFSWPAVTAKLDNLYNRLLESSDGPQRRTSPRPHNQCTQ